MVWFVSETCNTHRNKIIQGQIIYEYKYRLQCQRTLGSVLIVNCEPNTVVILKWQNRKTAYSGQPKTLYKKLTLRRDQQKEKTSDGEINAKYGERKKHTKKLLRISYWQYIEDIVIPKSLITPGQCVIQWNVFGSTSNKRNPDHQGISFIKQDGKNKHRPYPKILCHGISISQIFSSKENNSSHEFYKKM